MNSSNEKRLQLKLLELSKFFHPHQHLRMQRFHYPPVLVIGNLKIFTELHGIFATAHLQSQPQKILVNLLHLLNATHRQLERRVHDWHAIFSIEQVRVDGDAKAEAPGNSPVHVVALLRVHEAEQGRLERLKMGRSARDEAPSGRGSFSLDLLVVVLNQYLERRRNGTGLHVAQKASHRFTYSEYCAGTTMFGLLRTRRPHGDNISDYRQAFLNAHDLTGSTQHLCGTLPDALILMEDQVTAGHKRGRQGVRHPSFLSSVFQDRCKGIQSCSLNCSYTG
mmetsp:Transcript_46515/g.90868  ORF Transcript_46515/g.90868 Transcript_46515/m.90868 type:complete len:279 (+) Transcript_46515:26-862(+)